MHDSLQQVDSVRDAMRDGFAEMGDMFRSEMSKNDSILLRIANTVQSNSETMLSSFQAIGERFDRLEQRIEKIEIDIADIKDFVGMNKVRH